MLRMEDYIVIKALKERGVYQKDIAEQKQQPLRMLSS